MDILALGGITLFVYKISEANWQNPKHLICYVFQY